MLFVVLAVIYFFGVFFYRNKIASSSRRVKALKRKLSPIISEFLFWEEGGSKDEKFNYVALKVEMRELLKTGFNRTVLTELLLDLRKDVSGQARHAIVKLYQDLGLHKDAFEKLESWQWQIVSKGIQELTQMEVEESYGFITRFVNDKRTTIRKQAEIATVTLKNEGIKYFLDTTKYRISEWQQLKLLDVIRNKQDFQAPQFKAWLTSSNKYVVLFALRLIKHYNQNDAKTAMIALVKHRNNQIREEAISCIKEFYVTEAIETLKITFWNSSIAIKIAILDTIGEIGTIPDIEFLKRIDKKELNFSVKSKALSAINAISPNSIMPSRGIQEESSYDIPRDIKAKVVQKNEANHNERFGTTEEIRMEDTRSPEETKGMEDPELECPDHEPIELAEKLEKDHLMPKETNYQAGDDSQWTTDHLDFLPIITTEESLEEKGTRSPKQSEALKTSPEIFAMEVQAEEIESGKAAVIQEKDAKPLEVHIAFLPIVVENTVTENFKDPSLEAKDTEVREFEVVYDQVQVKEEDTPLPSAEEQQTVTVTEAELFDFLSKRAEMIPKEGHAERIDIREISVNFEAVPVLKTTDDVNELIVYDSIHVQPEPALNQESTPLAEEDLNFTTEPMELSKEHELALQKMIDDSIYSEGTEKRTEPLEYDETYVNPDWDLDPTELDFVPVSFEKEEKNNPNYIKIESYMEFPKAAIPKAMFGDMEFEASTRQLLKDLEELGNDREIPFLKELLTDVKYASFKERINTLIDKFNHSSSTDTDYLAHPFSVFKDLFRTCDTEAKLILMDEMVEVGDEKDLHFLAELIQEDSQVIREKAILVLQGLQEKLGMRTAVNKPEASPRQQEDTHPFDNLMEEGQSTPSEEIDSIFELNFEITTSSLAHSDAKSLQTDEARTVRYGSFFGQLTVLSNKILEKLYG